MVVVEWYRNLLGNLQTDPARSPSLLKDAYTQPTTGDLLRAPPTPMINPPEGFGLIWSAKVGSMSIMAWFICRLGMFERLRKYPRPKNPRPHSFRTRVLDNDPGYQQWVENCDAAELKWLRVIRSPYKRAVSSFRHAVLYGYEDRKIEHKMGLSIPERGLSFNEFLDYLLVIDVASCNVHHLQQWHPIEQQARPQKVVNIDTEDLLPALEAFEQEIGLEPLSPDVRAGMISIWGSVAAKHHSKREVSDQSRADIRFTRADAAGSWPSDVAFLDEETRAKIERIYAKDFAAYADFL